MARTFARTLALLAALLATTGWQQTTTDAAASRADTKSVLTGPEKLEELQQRARNGVVPFTNALFTRFGLRPERPYHLVLLLTAASAKHKCDACLKLAPEFELLSKSYEAAAQVKVDTRDGLDVIFAVADFETNQEVFRFYELTSAPFVVYVAPDSSQDTGAAAVAKEEVKPQDFYNAYTQGLAAEGMAVFVQQRTGFEFTIIRSKVYLYVFVAVAIVGLVVAAKLVVDHLDFLLMKLRRKQLWMTVSLLFYGLSVSGMVYCIIRNPPPYATDRKGNIQYFHSQGRQQYVYEGLIVGSYDVVAAVCVILLSQWALYVRNPIVRHLAIVGCVLGFLFTYRQMTGVYKMKNPWYSGWMGF
ncbi:unnamed protein product [Hyaloperonospora brassicae]|uniref:Magnesium transporter protein 1 n=1 Tax=Hyaloperonospora brassicae TaxID=162125 RepID=A0AAV0UZM4_HYABA|nr:unnamed protein product [Hyaloperonospora brassicae]